MTNPEIIAQAKAFETNGIGKFDALHVACAMSSQANVFVTTDDRLIKKMRQINALTTLLPGEAIAFVEDWYEN